MSLGAGRRIGWVVANIRLYLGAEAAVPEFEINVPANALAAGSPITDRIGGSGSLAATLIFTNATMGGLTLSAT